MTGFVADAGWDRLNTTKIVGVYEPHYNIAWVGTGRGVDQQQFMVIGLIATHYTPHEQIKNWTLTW